MTYKGKEIILLFSDFFLKWKTATWLCLCDIVILLYSNMVADNEYVLGIITKNMQIN